MILLRMHAAATAFNASVSLNAGMKFCLTTKPTAISTTRRRLACLSPLRFRCRHFRFFARQPRRSFMPRGCRTIYLKCRYLAEMMRRAYCDDTEMRAIYLFEEITYLLAGNI